MKTLISIILLFVNTAYAWNVEPMSNTLENHQRSFQLTINNIGNEILAVKLKAFARDTDGIGDDKLLPTKDIALFPKRLVINPKKTAIARVSIRKRNNSNIEKSYRVVVEQVPVRKQDDKPGVKVLTKYLTSLYLLPKKVNKETLEFSNAVAKENLLTLQAKNDGNTHKVLLIGNLKINQRDNQSKDIKKQFKAVNVLPKKTIQVVLPIAQEVLKNASSIEFNNNCISCKKGERYVIDISK